MQDFVNEQSRVWWDHIQICTYSQSVQTHICRKKKKHCVGHTGTLLHNGLFDLHCEKVPKDRFKLMWVIIHWEKKAATHLNYTHWQTHTCLLPPPPPPPNGTDCLCFKDDCSSLSWPSSVHFRLQLLLLLQRHVVVPGQPVSVCVCMPEAG